MYRGTNNREEEVGLGWGGLVPTAEERRAEKREESAQHSLQQLKQAIALVRAEAMRRMKHDDYLAFDYYINIIEQRACV